MFTKTSISNIVEKNRELWGKISHDYELKTDPGRVWNIGVTKWLAIKESGSCSRKWVSNVIHQVMYGEYVALIPSSVLTCYVDAT